MKRVAIIGGGAAGLMAASAVKDMAPDADVLIFEKNAYVGAKILISGGGRCNVTTGIFGVKDLLKNYPRGAKFLMSAMFRFPPEKVMEWFEHHGVHLKIEPDVRVFPVSDNGKDVVGALEKDLREKNVQIFLKANVLSVQKKAEAFVVGVKDDMQSYEVDYIVITTGGNAYRHTGSTGDGYAFARYFGHTITQLAPSLNSFVLAEEWRRDLAGVSLAKVKLTLTSVDSAKFYERIGPVLFTHTGITGPAVFALSALAAYEAYTKDQPMSLRINFFPDVSPEELESRFQDFCNEHGKKRLINLLDLLLPKSLCAILVHYLRIDGDVLAANIQREQRKNVLHALQNFNVHIVGRGAGDEFVTAGGVDLQEVQSHTMESKLCPRLYFAGEILDVDGFTGGFNLQASWATGRLAGEKIGQSIALTGSAN